MQGGQSPLDLHRVHQDGPGKLLSILTHDRFLHVGRQAAVWKPQEIERTEYHRRRLHLIAMVRGHLLSHLRMIQAHYH